MAATFEVVTAEEVAMAKATVEKEEAEEGVKMERSLSVDLAKELMDKAVVEEVEFSPETGRYLDFPFLSEERSWCWAREHLTMFVMRGLSGSGKSTVVSAIRRHFPGCVVCSADEFFLADDGTYQVCNWLLLLLGIWPNLAGSISLSIYLPDLEKQAVNRPNWQY